jgi:hypothetical protein
MTIEQLSPKASLGDIRLCLVIGLFGAIITLLLPICYLYLRLAVCDASGTVRNRLAKGR